MPPFLFGGCVLVGQIYFVYVKGFVGLYDCRTGGHIPFNVKSVFLVEVGKVFVVRVLRYIVLIAEKGAHAAQLQNTFSSVHNCDFVLCHQLFATMSSGELKKVANIKEFIFVATILIIFQPDSYCLTCTIREYEL